MFEMGAKFEDTWSSDNKKKKSNHKQSTKKRVNKHQLRLRIEKRRGKIVTICGAFFLEDKKSKELLATLKKKLGRGGTIRDEEMEFQGECRDKLKILLKQQGFSFKN